MNKTDVLTYVPGGSTEDDRRALDRVADVLLEILAEQEREGGAP